MKNSNLVGELVGNEGEAISRRAAIPCALSGKDFTERVAENEAEYDGEHAPCAGSMAALSIPRRR